MNTSQITHALEQDPVTSKKFCGVFPSEVASDDRQISLRTRIQAVSLERIGSPSTSHRNRKENSLTVTDMHQITIGIHLETF
jgi:hypothetical protein